MLRHLTQKIKRFQPLIVLTLSCYVPSVFAVPWVVNNLNDAGPGSLREAMINAGNGDSIYFADGINGTINLASPLPVIKQNNITIHGRQADNTPLSITISGGNTYAIFFAFGNNGAATNVTIGNFTLQQGRSEGGAGGVGRRAGGGGGGLGAGGAIFVNRDVNMTVENVRFDANVAQGGAGGAIEAGVTSRAGGGGGGMLGGLGGSRGASDENFNGSGGGGGFGANGGLGGVFTPAAPGFNGGIGLLTGLTKGGDGGNGTGVGQTNGGTGGATGGGGGGGGAGATTNEQGSGGGGGSGTQINYASAGSDVAATNGGTDQPGGAGGFGGGGGGAPANGGDGGFGGGGGGGLNGAGTPGFGGGNGSTNAQGNGGSGYGGSIFVRKGGSLTIVSDNGAINTNFTNGNASGGNGTVNGTGEGTDLYIGSAEGLPGGQPTTIFNVTNGVSQRLEGTIYGPGALQKIGSGTLILGRSQVVTINGYTGGTSVQGGTLQGTTSSITGNVAMSNFSTLTFLQDIGSNTYAGVISGDGHLVKSSGGALPQNVTLSGNNTYTGTTTVNTDILTLSGTNIGSDATNGRVVTINNGGTLKLGADNVFDVNNAVTVNAGGTLDIDTRTQTFLTLEGAGNVSLNGGSLTFGNNTTKTLSGVISGTGSLTYQNGGTQTLSGANTFTGTVTISGGSGLLELASSGAIGNTTVGDNSTLRALNANILAATSSLTLNGDSPFYLNGFDQRVGDLVAATNRPIISLGAYTLTINPTTASVTYAGVIQDTGNLVKDGANTQILSGQNTYSGTTTVNGGELQVATNGSTLGNVTINSGTFKPLNDDVLVATNTVTVGTTGVFDLNNTDQSIDALISPNGTASTILSNTKTLTLLAATDGGSATFAGVVSGAGNIYFNASGTNKTGEQQLIGNNTYTGTTTVEFGTLQLAGTGVGGDVTVISGGEESATLVARSANIINSANNVELRFVNATFDLNDFDQTIGDLTGAGTVQLGAAILTLGTATPAVTFYGGIQGTGKLIKQNAGTVILAEGGTINYSGGTDITGGQLQGNTVTLQGNFAITNGAAIVFDQSANGTFTGVVSAPGPGTGRLIKNGAAELTLSGANTYDGGTTVSAGVLEANTGTLPSAVGVVVNAGGTLRFNQAVIGNYTGPVTGAGNVVKQGAVQLTLSNNNNAYTGTTTVDTGTLVLHSTQNQLGDATINNAAVLQFGNANVLSTNSLVTLSNAGTELQLNDFNQQLRGISGSGNVDLGPTAGTVLTLNLTGDLTFSGKITNNGDLVKGGANKLTLSSTNALPAIYTGATTINAGTLEGNTISLPSAAGRSISVLGGATLTFNQTADGVFAANITGAGQVTKTGAGALTMSGNYTHTGGTQVDAGTLYVGGGVQLPQAAGDVTVNAGAILGGAGTVVTNLINTGGTVAPGMGTIGDLIVGANYNPNAAATTSFHLTPTTNSQLIITGNANLDGHLAFTPQAGTYVEGKSYTIITAAAVNGTFATVDALVSGFKPEIFYEPVGAPTLVRMELFFVENSISARAAAGNQNQRNIAKYLDEIRQAGVPLNGDMNQFLGVMSNLPGQELFDALDSMNVGRLTAGAVAVLDNGSLINALNTARLSALRYYAANDSDLELGYFAPRSDLLNLGAPVKGRFGISQPRQFTTSRAGLIANASRNMPYLLKRGTKGANIWAQGFGHIANLHPRLGDPGYRARSNGIVGGVDYQATHQHFWGAGFGHYESTVNLNDKVSNIRVSNNFLTFYGTWFRGGLYVEGSLMGGLQSYQVQQNIQVQGGAINAPGISVLGGGDYRGYSLDPHMGVGYVFDVNTIRFEPYFTLDFGYVREQAYVLDTGNYLSQNVQKRTSVSLRRELGLKISKTFEFSQGRFSPDFGLSYISVRPYQQDTQAGFVGQPGYYSARNFVNESSLYAAGVGFSVENNFGTFASARLSTENGSAYQSYEISLRLGIRF